MLGADSKMFVESNINQINLRSSDYLQHVVDLVGASELSSEIEIRFIWVIRINSLYRGFIKEAYYWQAMEMTHQQGAARLLGISHIDISQYFSRYLVRGWNSIVPLSYQIFAETLVVERTNGRNQVRIKSQSGTIQSRRAIDNIEKILSIYGVTENIII